MTKVVIKNTPSHLKQKEITKEINHISINPLFAKNRKEEGFAPGYQESYQVSSEPIINRGYKNK